LTASETATATEEPAATAISDPAPKVVSPPKPKKRAAHKEDLIESIKRKEKKEILDVKKQEQIDLIKAFSKKDIKLATIKEIEANQNTENLADASTSLNDKVLSETFAKILLKQGKKAMAIEIYEKLALKFPEKRAYFADLIEKTKE
jgi:tRNA U54 and U55 pseudouridine synthase Pus10